MSIRHRLIVTSDGVYILNLETGTAVFYEMFAGGSRVEQFNIVGWAKKSGVDSILLNFS